MARHRGSFTDFQPEGGFPRRRQDQQRRLSSLAEEGGIPAETGYELQIWDFRPTYKTGSLVNALEAEPAKILADQWNSYEITAEGTTSSSY